MSFLIIDKPAGMTSFDVIRQLRKITGVRKMGHAGTLDPMATGVLVIALDKATKHLASLIGKDKEYVAEVVFGVVSDTYDREGRMREGLEIRDRRLGIENRELRIENQELKLTEERIRMALKDFVGEIEQRPPVYSALKVGGKRACDIARAGGSVDLKARRVRVYGIEVVKFDKEASIEFATDLGPPPNLPLSTGGGITPASRQFFPPPVLRRGLGGGPRIESELSISHVTYQLPLLTLKIHCGSGFYVRSLAHDLGQKLGCGAVLWNLRRTRVGEFRIEEAMKLENLDRENWQEFSIIV